MKILISAHNDDETLYGAYTILREKPLVVVITDSARQGKRGLPITAEQRIMETEMAMDILDAKVEFLHIPDDELTVLGLEPLLKYNAEMIYAPTPEINGNLDHSRVGNFAKERLNNVVFYSTYTSTRPYPDGIPIIPTEEEQKLKMMALDCYQSQLNMSNKVYFDYMRYKPECITPTK